MNTPTFRSFVITRSQLQDLYLVLVAGSNQPEFIEVVMWLSSPEEGEVDPSSVFADCYILRLHDGSVGDIVKYAQSVQEKGNYVGPELSNRVRTSLTKGRLKR